MKRRFARHTSMLFTLVTTLLLFGWTSLGAHAAQQIPLTSTRTVTVVDVGRWRDFYRT